MASASTEGAAGGSGARRPLSSLLINPMGASCYREISRPAMSAARTRIAGQNMAQLVHAVYREVGGCQMVGKGAIAPNPCTDHAGSNGALNIVEGVVPHIHTGLGADAQTLGTMQEDGRVGLEHTHIVGADKMVDEVGDAQRFYLNQLHTAPTVGDHAHSKAQLTHLLKEGVGKGIGLHIEGSCSMTKRL